MMAAKLSRPVEPTDPLYDKPFVDIDEWRDQPMQHVFLRASADRLALPVVGDPPSDRITRTNLQLEEGRRSNQHLFSRDALVDRMSDSASRFRFPPAWSGDMVVADSS